VKNPRNSNNQKFVVINLSHPVYCHCSCDLTFWNGHDIDVANDYDANTDSYTNLGTPSVNNTGITGEQVFTSEQYVTVQAIEVFSISVGMKNFLCFIFPSMNQCELIFTQ
jgi:hypothetical protein